MTETNHASEAAASSPENQIRVKLEQAIDQLTGIVRRHAAGPNALDRFPPSLADIEKAKGAIRHLVDWQIDEQRGLQAELVRLRTQLVRNVLTSHADVGGAETRVVAFGWEGSDPMPTWLDIERTTPGSGMTRRLVHEAVVEKMRADRDAWKHKADTLGGDLNRIRSLVPTASDEQTTFDAVQDYLAKRHKERDASSKALFDVAIALEESDGAHGTSENLAPRIRALLAERQRLRAEIEQLVWNLAGISTIANAEDLCGYEPGKEWERPALSDTVKLVRTVKDLRAELTPLREAVALMATAKPDMQVDANDPVGMARQVVELVERLRQDGLTALNAAYGQRKRAEEAEARAKKNGMSVTERSDRIRQLHDDLATIRAALVRCGRAVGGKMADDVSLEFLGYIPAEVERVVERMRAELAASEKRVAELGCSLAMTPKSALTEEAQTAIAAMRDVGPELAKAGIQVGPRLSHAEAIAQLRGERDRWREKFEGAHQLVDEAARFEGAVVADLAAHGVFATGGLGGVRFAVGKVLAELARLRKESKRDQVGKQQALLDKIARLFPGKGPLLDRVKHAAKVVEQDAIAERLCGALGIDNEKTLDWLEAMRRTEPKCDVALAPIKEFVDEAVRKVVERARKAGGLPAFGDPFGLFTRRDAAPFGSAPCNFGGTKVAPATGQPRTEAPLAADGSGTVVELGEAFRQNLSNAVACLPDGAIDPTTIKIAIRNLHTAVAELAKVVERIGVRS